MQRNVNSDDPEQVRRERDLHRRMLEPGASDDIRRFRDRVSVRSDSIDAVLCASVSLGTSAGA